MATIGKIAAFSAYDVFSWCKYLIVGLVFSRRGLWSGGLLLVAPFPDLCLFVPFQRRRRLNIMVIYMYIGPGWGQVSPWGPICFQNH